MVGIADDKTSPVDVTAVVDRAEWSGVPLRVFVLAVLAMVFDGFDIQAIAFAAPQLVQDFGISRTELAPLLAAGLVGLAVGAVLLGAVSDRYGRKVAVTASLSLVALMSLGTAFARSPDEIMYWRFATGIGLGGMAPSCMALVSEFAPKRVRNLAVALTIVGVPIGGVLGAEVAARIAPLFGWQSIFVIGAVLPGVLAVVVLGWLPESPRYLARRGDRPAQLAALLNHISRSRTFDSTLRFIVHEPGGAAERAQVSALFTSDFRRDTLLIWLIFITNIFAVYCFFGWLPTVLTSAGLPLEVALRGTLLFNLGGVASSLIAALCISRFGSRAILRIIGAGSIAATFALGLASTQSTSLLLLLALMTLAGACLLGVQNVMYAVVAAAYPTPIRSTGLGWAAGISRIGGFLSSFAGGALISLGEGPWPFFVAISVVLCPTLFGVVMLRRHLAAQVQQRH